MKSILILLFTWFMIQANCQTDTNKVVHKVGDHFGGGIIFFLGETGQHGLIAAPYDQAYQAMWGNFGRTDALYMNDGAINTERIIASTSEKSKFQDKIAACICDTLTLGGFEDWYLPSINELKDMYEKQKVIGNFVALDYCSSTESSFSDCWNIHFRPHRRIIFHYKKYYETYAVRCIRKF
ncbi:MAG: hypothetical protein ABIJ04_12155 [Bacteroidota bacterium]